MVCLCAKGNKASNCDVLIAGNCKTNYLGFGLVMEEREETGSFG